MIGISERQTSLIRGALGLFLILLLAATAGCAQKNAGEEGVEGFEIGNTAPDFSQDDSRGNTISLKEYLKDYDVLLVDFWATWCGPCIAEIPNVKAVYEKYSDQGFGILGVSLDLAPDAGNPQQGQKTAEDVRAFMDELGMSWTTTYDGLWWRNAVVEQYQINSIPATLLLDSEGVIRYKNLRGGELERAVKKMLKGSGER